MSHLTKGVLRSAKNYTKGYSDTQAKVRDATSNDPLPPSGQQLNEIAQMTMNQQDFIEVMEMLDKRLNDKGKNWRHVFKSLLVLDFCLFQGSENVGIYFRDNMYIIKTLREFQYVDEEGKDQGANVRQKAKDITNLLMNDSRLRDGRKDKGKMKDRMRDDSDRLGGSLNGSSAGSQRKQGHGEDEDAMRKAIEESKRSAALKQAEDRDLMQAIQRSEEEEAKRVKAVEDANASALFDDEQQQPAGNFTLVDPSQYTQGLQPQYTQIQPQFTAFNPYQQQADQEAMQAQYLQQQQEWQLMQQQQQLQQQQQQQQLLQQQQQQLQQQQQAEEWMRQQQLLQLQQQQQQQLQPQPTGFGTKNPFAPSSSPIPPMPSLSPQPPSSIDRKPVEFNLQGTFSSSPSLSPTYTPPPPQPNSLSPTPAPQFRPPKRADDDHAELANLFANRDDGQDTFGNIGALRYGHTDAGRVVVQKTGVSNNPFGQQQQQQLQQVSNERPFFDI